MKKIIITTVVILILALGMFGIYSYAKNKDNTEESKYLKELDFNGFKTKLDNKDTFFVLFKQDNCSACATFEPIFIKVLEEYEIYGFTINFSKLNENDRKELQQIVSIDGTPTTIFIVDGDEETTANRLSNVSSNGIISRLKSLGYIKE